MNPSTQQQAVLDWISTGEGSLNLIARAGCGKTSTLMMGAKLIEEKRLGSVVFLAYNKSIAEEIKFKLQKDGLYKCSASTVHSAGFAAWRKVCGRLQVDEKKVFNIVRDMSKEQGDFYDRNLNSICNLVSLAKQSGFGFLHSITDNSAWFALADHHGVNDLTEGDDTDMLVAHAIPVLKQSLSMDRYIIDFDDMILAPLVHNAKCFQYDWVLLDEAQDTNASRRALAMKMIKPKTGRLIAVGDDRQAIYGFTGADSNAMSLIAEELNSDTLYLTVTYRCPKAIVADANRLVSDLEAHESAPDGITRTLRIVENGKNWFDTEPPAKTSVVLCRNTKPLIEQAYAMLRSGIGCRVEGLEIGEGLIALINRWKRVNTISSLANKLCEYRDRETQKWMAKGKEERAQQIDDKVGTILVLIDKLLEEGKSGLSDLVSFIRSLFGDTKPGMSPNVVTLSTVHKSKGREWDTVYLLDRNGLMPSKWARKDWQLLQEANLEYVAITRAKKELVDLGR